MGMGVRRRAAAFEQAFQRGEAGQRAPRGEGEQNRDHADRGQGRERA
jgi:hypothetical protein